MHLVTVGVMELKSMVETYPVAALYVGASTDPVARSMEHESHFPPPVVMYVAHTSNMNNDENQLLAKCRNRGGCSYNVQQTSNMLQIPGYVYAVFPFCANVINPYTVPHSTVVI